MTLRDVLIRYFNKFETRIRPIPCTVNPGTQFQDLDGYYCIVTPILEQTSFQRVKISADAGNGMVLIPADNSLVFIHRMDDNDAYICAYSGLQDVIFIDGTYAVKMLDGSYGGLVKVASLVTKINNLENLVNDLITKYNSHTHVVTSTPSTSATPLPVEGSTISPVTQRSDLENTHIIHGKP